MLNMSLANSTYPELTSGILLVKYSDMLLDKSSNIISSIPPSKFSDALSDMSINIFYVSSGKLSETHRPTFLFLV